MKKLRLETVTEIFLQPKLSGPGTAVTGTVKQTISHKRYFNGCLLQMLLDPF